MPDLEELLNMLGGKYGTEGLAELTEDERAIVRLLRACEEETVELVVKAIVEAVDQGRFLRSLLDVGTVSDDFIRLKKIEADGGRYIKGFTRDTIKSVLAHLPNPKKNSVE